MSEQINSGQVDEQATPDASGLLLSVEPLQASAQLNASDGILSDTNKDGGDTSDDAGSDTGDDASDTDSSDTSGADTDLTDTLGADTDGSDAAADADGTDDSDSSIKIDTKDA
jgi:hypothetical protein